VFPPQASGETNVSIIDAIANDKPAVFQVNIPDRGSIPSVADDVVVEIPALVSASGIQGLHMGDLPKPIMCHLLEKVMFMERDLEAFRTGDKRILLELILASPWNKIHRTGARYTGRSLGFAFQPRHGRTLKQRESSITSKK